ncbi:MAG TPA: hypothetical protein VFD71_05165 [Planctomycetota bacterium]|nr:hypothetical protein [Planctomycetota bacterium]
MVGESLETALNALKVERERLNGAIESLEGILSGGHGATRAMGARRGRRRGRPAKALGAAPAAGVGGRKRKNAPKGLLRKTILGILKSAKRPLAPVELRNAVMKAGYPNKNEKTLYTAVFTAAKKDPAIKKTSDGFALK